MKLFGYDRALAVREKQSKVAYINAATQLMHQQKSNVLDLDRLLLGDGNHTGAQFRNITFSDEFLYYKHCSPLFTALDMVAGAAADIEPVLIDTTSGAPEVVRDHAVLDFLKQPNGWQERTRDQLFYSFITFCLLNGNTFMETTGDVREPPDELKLVSVIRVDGEFDPRDGIPSQYTAQSSVGGASTIYKRNENIGDRIIRFYNQDLTKELWHTRRFNPIQGELFGTSSLEPLFVDIEQWLSSSNHNWSLLKNGARMSGAFVAPPAAVGQLGLTPDQIEAMAADLDQFYSGSNNAGRPAILSGGLEWREMSQSNKDMDFGGRKKSVVEQIYTTIKIPLPLISPDHQNFSNFEFAQIAFFKNAVLPKYRLMLSEINAMILNRYPDTEGMHLGVIESDIPALEKLKFDAALVLKTIGVSTIDEIRTKLGFEGIDGEAGDTIFMPSGLIPVGEDQFTEDELEKPTTNPKKSAEISSITCDQKGSPLLRLIECQELLNYQDKDMKDVA